MQLTAYTITNTLINGRNTWVNDADPDLIISWCGTSLNNCTAISFKICRDEIEPFKKYPIADIFILILKVKQRKHVSLIFFCSMIIINY